MKMMFGDTPMKSVMLHTDSDDATLKASDLQSGVTAYAKGQKVTGSGKSFEFAYYGAIETNVSVYIPNNVNVVEIASTSYPVQLSIALSDMKTIDFTTEQTVANITVNGTVYPLKVKAANNIIAVTCSQALTLQIFYGKDNYV